ncbi:hypothetical protein [Chryseobacterium sp. ERMR1:04]|uniref:hypothetical protein n=1 Tax=Chryseobacterium sp. ERMR1:04 TaxID=1705393 RepID=UPI0006C86B3D|nr:hypothetical protein [Chryseobacterium sp. ERMR1:04]KPH11855.1 hypothetical protein AMQ68_21100 [Chryseobacterium sp. ERMR1:04]
MEINDLTILKYITPESVNILSSYLEKDSRTYSILEKYEEISYLGASEKFFFLFKEHEKFINRNHEILNKHSDHLLSVMGLLFQLETYGYRHENNSIFEKAYGEFGYVIPIDHSFPEDVNIEYRLTDNDSSVCIIDLFFNIELNKIMRRVMERYQDHSNYGRSQFLNYDIAFSDLDVINLYPYLFKGTKELENHMKIISEKFNFFDKDKIIDNFQIINNKIHLAFEEITSRTKCNYIKCYNYFDFRSRALSYSDENDELLTYLDKYFFPRKLSKYDPQYYITFFIVSIDFELPDLEFVKDYDKKYYCDDNINIYDSVHGYKKLLIYNDEVKNENLLKDDIKNMLNSSNYKNLLKVNIDLKKTIMLFEGLVDKILPGNKQLKRDFKDLFKFVTNESIKIFPTTNELTVENIKYIMRFLNNYKSLEFDYNISDLQYLLTHFANKPEHEKNTSIYKAHSMDRFKLDRKTQNELNSLVR